jgi:chitodextrinase
MTKLAAPAQAWWYDPTNGTFAAIPGSPFANAGTHTFTPSGSHGDGSADWVLVLEATVPPDTQAPSVPAGLSSTGVSSSEIDSSWAPSADGSAVAGYQVFRNGVLQRTTPATSFADTGLSPLTSYSYTVAAADYFDNLSAESAPLVVTTAGPGPTFVQQSFATPQSPQTPVGATYAGAETAGDTNIVAIGWNDTTSTITSVTDGAGNTYQTAIATFRGNGLSQAVYYAANIHAAAAGTNTVTVTFNQPAAFVDLRVTEYSGLRPTSPFDAGASNSGGSGGTASSGALTTAAPSELLFAAGMTGAVFSAPGAGFTSRVITVPDGDLVEDAVATSTGSHNATASLSGGTWLLQLAAFRGP